MKRFSGGSAASGPSGTLCSCHSRKKAYAGRMLLFRLGFAAFCLSCLSACGKPAAKESSAANSAAAAGPETTAPAVTLPAETPAEDAETAPAPGMVRSCLTHEWVAEAVNAERPIAVMYPTDKKAQPQYGISRAEIFYEIMEEGDMTRQMAVIKDWEDLARIGNIRSIRDYFIHVGLEWDPVFVHAGGPEVFVKKLLTRPDVDNINSVGGVMGSDYGAFYRVPAGTVSVHKLYTDAAHITSAIQQGGFKTTHSSKYIPEPFRFHKGDTLYRLEDRPESAEGTEVDLSGAFPISSSTYSYHPEDGLYYKNIYGAPQKDAADGRQLAFSNLLIEACQWGERGKSYKMFQTIDKGQRGWFLTGGRIIPVTWEKADDYAPTHFYDADGQEIQLNTGRTAISIIRAGKDSFTVNGTVYQD